MLFGIIILLNRKNKKNEFYEQLKNVFEQIQSNCSNNTWGDFKSIFNKNGSSVRIEWEGDADIINYLFRKLHKVLSYKGKKWEVIASYFHKTDKTMDAKNLANNTHFNENKNPKFVKHLEKLIFHSGLNTFFYLESKFLFLQTNRFTLHSLWITLGQCGQCT